jgi:hypothetical protein
MSYVILHVLPYMHASAGGPTVMVANCVAEAGRFIARRSSQRSISAMAPEAASGSAVPETIPVIGRCANRRG